MSTPLLTVEQAAAELSLHPKTVQRYIREGKLRATRVGKSYRIPRPELDALVGITANATAPRAEARTTCIADVPDLEVGDAERIAIFLQAAAMTGDANASKLQLQTAFDPASGVLKVVMIGSVMDVSKLLELLQLQLGAQPR